MKTKLCNATGIPIKRSKYICFSCLQSDCSQYTAILLFHQTFGIGFALLVSTWWDEFQLVETQAKRKHFQLVIEICLQWNSSFLCWRSSGSTIYLLKCFSNQLFCSVIFKYVTNCFTSLLVVQPKRFKTLLHYSAFVWPHKDQMNTSWTINVSF